MITTRKKKFIEQLTQGKSATEAAKIAGYSAKAAPQIGSRLLKDADVRAAMDSFNAEQRAKISRDNFISRAWSDYESSQNPSSRARFLEISGKALGYLGGADVGNVTNNTQINLRIEKVQIAQLSDADKLKRIRALLESST